MGVAVYNVSATSARVSWPPSPGCLDTFYSVMYDPNWNSLMKGYKRKSFLHEERIPVSQTSAHLANLLPQTAYFLCVTCQAANPVQDQCQMFSTPGDSGEAHDRAGWELAVGVWLTCCALLLVIAGILLWGCLRVSWPPGGGFGRPYATRRPSEDGAALQPSRLIRSAPTGGHVGAQEHEMRALSRLETSRRDSTGLRSSKHCSAP